MKKLLLGICFFAMCLFSIAQQPASGTVREARSGLPVAGATIEVPGIESTLTNSSGFFQLKKTLPGLYRMKVTCIGYKPFETRVSLERGPLTILLEEMELFLQPIEVKALRAGEKAPFTKTNLSREEIEKMNLGQDLPFLLNQTPSVVINSDAGNGVGYTGFYIRGTDATRVNMTLNGIPYNDAEDQSIYFVDLPDFASSVSSVQIQRGVGTSSNGAGAFGASINFSTNEFNEKPYAEFNNSYGSFNTWKNTIKVGSGLLNGHFTLDARLSRISSDGYIDRATSDLKSCFLSAAYYSKKSSLRFNLIAGTEKTYQAWNGIPEAKLNGDRQGLDQHYSDNVGSLYFTQADSLNLYNSGNRTYNYFTYSNQTDNYWQNHYQLFFNHQVNPHISLNLAGFLTRGYGYYEEFRNQDSYASYNLAPVIRGNDTLLSSDFIRQRWLSNYFYGGIYSLQYRNKGTQFTLGGGWDRYDGKHYGIINWASNGGVADHYQYYHTPADKTDFNVYGKIQQQLGEYWTAYADLQLRAIHYHINGFEDNPSLYISRQYLFFNPKAGISYSKGSWQAGLSYAQSNHEPNRGDFEASQQQQPRAETLHDIELNLEQKNHRYSWSITGYYMIYRNQLVLNGKINDVGEYTRINIPDSYRLGAELQGSVQLTDWLSAGANLSISSNKVKNYTEYIDDYDNGGQKSYSYHQTDIAFSPELVSASTLNILPFRHAEVSLMGKYVSKEYLDNAQHEDRKLDGYYVENLRLSYTLTGKSWKDMRLVLQVNNLFDKKYAPNGYTYSYLYGGRLVTENFLFPMATTNFLIAVNIRL